MIAALAVAVMLAGCAPTVVPAGERVQAPRLTENAYIAADGATLALAIWPAAKGSPNAVVLALHGFGEHRGMWEEPAEIWAKSGISTVAYDQRGFGSSASRGRWAGTDTLVEDAKAVAALLRQRHPGVPLYLAGESMGGALALVAADRKIDADGLILLATALRTRESLGPLASVALWFLAHTIPWLPAGPTSIDYKPTDNPKALEKMRKDPMILRQPRLDMGYGLVDLMDAARDAAARIDRPYLMLHGQGDRIVPQEPVRAVVAAMPRRADSTITFYKEGYHLLLRDKEGPTVARDIAAWIAARTARE